MTRIDTHLHTIPPFYRDALRTAGIDTAGGRELPDWSVGATLETMSSLAVTSAVLSVSTPGTTFLTDPTDAARLAAELNDHSADIVRDAPDRFGFVATVPSPHVTESAREVERALEDLGADGVTLLANAHGAYLGAPGSDALWEVLDARGAVVFVHPAELPAPPVEGIPPFATDFLLDTTRAAYLLVRNDVVRRHPNIRFLLSHGGGFVPYASHRMAITIAGETGRSVLDVLDDFQSFYFDTALSSSRAALPTLLEFALPGHVTFGSDWPFAPTVASAYFTAGLDSVSADDRVAIDQRAAARLFPRLAGAATDPVPASFAQSVGGAARRAAMRVVTRAMRP